MKEEHLNHLAAHATQITLALIREVSRDGIIRTSLPDGSVAADLSASHHLIELLAVLDSRIFREEIVSALTYLLEPSNMASEHPFTLDSYALVCGVTAENTELFRRAIAVHQLSDGSIPVYTAYLGGGDYFSTLWSTKIMARYSSSVFEPEIRLAIRYLKERREVGCTKTSHAGFLGLLLSQLDNKEALIETLSRDLLRSLLSDSEVPLIDRLFILEDLLEMNRLLRDEALSRLLEDELSTLFPFDEEIKLPPLLAEAQTNYSDSLYLETLARVSILTVKYLEESGVSGLAYSVNSLVHSDYRNTRYTALETSANLREFLQIYGPLHETFSGYNSQLERAWREHPFDRSVFLMMPFRQSVQYRKLTEVVREECQRREFRAVRVDDEDRHFDDGLWDNLVVNMLSCKYAIAVYVSEQVVDRLSGDEVKFFPNPNVALEFGFFKSRGQEVLLLKDRRSTLPTDLQGFLWREFDIENPDLTLPQHLRRWLDKIVSSEKPAGGAS